MMGDPVADVGPERGQHVFDHLGGARRPDDRQRGLLRRERRHPSGDQQITEVGNVVAVQVGQQQGSQAVRAHTDRRRPLKNTAAAVRQERLPTRADQG
jgi:hypothetical protein